MKRIIIIISFIPWFIYFLYQCKNALKDLNNNKLERKWVKKNVLKVFHFDNLILFGIFVFFAVIYRHSDQIFLTKLLLFISINLYLLINRLYDKNRNQKNISTEDISTMLLIIILTMIPMGYYSLTGHYTVTYYIMFAYSFFNYFIVRLCTIINNLIVKIVRKRNHED